MMKEKNKCFSSHVNVHGENFFYFFSSDPSSVLDLFTYFSFRNTDGQYCQALLHLFLSRKIWLQIQLLLYSK